MVSRGRPKPSLKGNERRIICTSPTDMERGKLGGAKDKGGGKGKRLWVNGERTGRTSSP